MSNLNFTPWYVDGEGNRIVVGDIVTPNPKYLDRNKLRKNSRWKVTDLGGDDVEIVGVSSKVKGQTISLGLYNVIVKRSKK